MAKYLITRKIPGASSIAKHELDSVLERASEAILAAMRNEGKDIQQAQSFVAGDTIYCVYNAASEDLIHEHAERSKGVVTEIAEISSVIKHNTSVISWITFEFKSLLSNEFTICGVIPGLSPEMDRMTAVYQFDSVVDAGKFMDQVGLSPEFQKIVSQASELGTLVQAGMNVRI